MSETDVASGAEAKVFNTDYLGYEAVVKKRVAKSYRCPELDKHLRLVRMKNEARLIIDARSVGVRTPFVYDIDTEECNITMERINGMKIKDVFDQDPERAFDICTEIGRTIAILHNNKISHGDLTTSNMILTDSGELCIIDFSMGSAASDIEAMGVDIRLLERAFSSAHPRLEKEYAELLRSYCETMKESKAVMRKVEDIKNRGRYT